MYRLTASVAAAALLATGAFAQTSDSGTITLQAEIAGYIEVVIIDSNFRYNNVNAEDGFDAQSVPGQNLPGARFDVIANVDFTLSFTYPTFQPTAFEDRDSNSPPTFQQAQFSNTNGAYIGGSLKLDTDLGNIANNSGGGIVQQGGSAPFFPSLGTQGAGTKEYILGASIEPRYSSTGALPAPGIYSIDVVITATAV